MARQYYFTVHLTAGQVFLTDLYTCFDQENGRWKLKIQFNHASQGVADTDDAWASGQKLLKIDSSILDQLIDLWIDHPIIAQ